MPSPRHDTINELFRERPEFAVEVLRDLMGVDVPEAGPAQIASNAFNDRPSKDFQPDTVITVGPRPSPVHGIIVEVQQKEDASKLRQLPRYAASLWLFLGRPVTLLCVCPDRGAAAYYAEPIATELPGYVFRALVLGPDDVPVITDPEDAAAHPELAAMAVMMHGERNKPVIKAFVDGLTTAKPDHAPKYYEYAHKMAAPAVRRILEELVSAETWPVYSPFAKEHFGRGKAAGREEGREEGRDQGRAEEGAHAVLTVLATRGVEVPDSARARIHACTDVQELEAWLERAVVVKTVDELFD